MESIDSDLDPVWIKNVDIYDCDLKSLQQKDETENASQKVLKDQFSVGGCQNTALTHSLEVSRAPNASYRYTFRRGQFCNIVLQCLTYSAYIEVPKHCILYNDYSCYVYKCILQLHTYVI